MIETGGVPATGFKLYSVDENEVTTLEFDGTDMPEILTTVVTDLVLDKDYTFYITGLNPLESEPSEVVSYRASGLPTACGAITEITDSRSGSRLGLQWEDSSSDGGSPILVYTLAQVQENLEDEVVYYGASLSIVLDNLISGRTYTYYVRATNLVGDGAWSSQYTFLIVEKPSAPLDLRVVSFDDTMVSIAWD
jgi:hypothetical protein